MNNTPSTTGIYCWLSPSNKRYFGQAVNLKKRVGYKKYRTNNHHLKSAFIKYGDQMRLIIICECKESELDYLEKFYIVACDSTNNKHGYNKTEGGEGGRCSEETRAKISNALKGYKHTAEAKANMAAAHNQKGYKHTAKTRANMSAAAKRRKKPPPYSSEHCAKISAALKGKKLSPEHRAKVSAARKGQKHTAETKAKISAGLIKRNNRVKYNGDTK